MKKHNKILYGYIDLYGRTVIIFINQNLWWEFISIYLVYIYRTEEIFIAYVT